MSLSRAPRARRSRAVASYRAVPLSILAASVLLGACGGGQKDAAAPATPPEDSIGAMAAAKGGLGSLGGSSEGSPAGGPAASLRALRIEKSAKPNMDGVPREFAAPFAAKEVLSGAPKATFGGTVEYDEDALYVGATVNDDTFVRTARFADGEDRVVLALAFPTGGGSFASYDVSLFAGRPGESAGAVRYGSGPRKGQEVPGAHVVEAPADHGYTLEASVPWAAFPEARHTRVGLRGSLRYVDAEAPGRVRGVLATGPGDASQATQLPPLPTEPEIALEDGLLGPKGLGTTPRLDVIADVVGDAMKERVAVFGGYLVVLGPSYREGQQFFVREPGGDVQRLEAKDVTGRGKADIVLRLRADVAGTSRESVQVWSFLQGDEPKPVFAQEISVSAGDKRVSNGVRMGKKEIEITTEAASGWDAGSYREPTASDLEPVLLPWGTVKSRVYKFDGKHFATASEVKQAGQAPAESSAPRGSVALGPEPKTPPVKTQSDLSQDVLDLFKKDRGIPRDKKPRFDLEVNVAEDPRPERVALFGREIVVLGPGFKGGHSYSYLTLQQFEGEADVTEITARDLTGRGVANLVVRGVRRVNAAGTSDPVSMDVLFVYGIENGNLARLFGIETAREQGKSRVQGLVQFVPQAQGKGFDIDVRPGRAQGWSEKTYPWTQDKPGGAMEPLLLPWGGITSLRYGWNGKGFTPR